VRWRQSGLRVYGLVLVSCHVRSAHRPRPRIAESLRPFRPSLCVTQTLVDIGDFGANSRQKPPVGPSNHSRNAEGPGSAHSTRDNAQVTAAGAVTSMIVAVSTRPNKQNRSTCSRMSPPIALMPPRPCEPVHIRCAPMRRKTHFHNPKVPLG